MRRGEGIDAVLHRHDSTDMLPRPLEPDANLVDLRILATSDVHGWLADWDYHAAQPSSACLARAADLVDLARVGSPNTMLFDNGDFLQGSPLADQHAAMTTANPVIAAMNHMRYDAATLGNHEFNFGLGVLEAVLAEAEFPVVSANVSHVDGRPLVARSVVLDRRVVDGHGGLHDLRVGVIGFLPVQIMTWDAAHLTGRLRVEAMTAAARNQLPDLRAHCDVVVALCHAGIGSASAPDTSEDAATALAGIDGIDVVIAGHSHLVFPSPQFRGVDGVDADAGTLQGKPAVMPGARGSHLGVVDLRLRIRDWGIVSARSAAVPVGSCHVHQGLLEVIRAPHDAVRARMEQAIGHNPDPINSFFAMVAPSRATALIADASARHLRGKMKGTILGTGQPFKCGGRGGPSHYTDIPAGKLALRHAGDLYGYPNTIAALHLTGEEIRLWLERAAGAFRQIRAGGTDQMLLDPHFPSYNFDLVHGVDFTIDLSSPAMFDGAGLRVSDGRIRNLTLGGAPLDPAAAFVVATSSYRAGGSGGFAPRPPSLSDPTRLTDVLADYMADPAPPPETPFWRFGAMPGTSVTFATSPRAVDHMDEVSHLALTPLGLDAAGFMTMRLAL